MSSKVLPFGPRTARLAIIGDGPGEDDLEKAFSGRCGQFVRADLADLKVDPNTVWWATIYDDRETPTPERTLELGKRMEAQLAEMPNLKAVLCLGATAAVALLHKPMLEESIEKTEVVELRKRHWQIQDDKVSVGVTHHPEALLHTGGTSSKWYAAYRGDLTQAVAVAEVIEKGLEGEDLVHEMDMRDAIYGEGVEEEAE